MTDLPERIWAWGAPSPVYCSADNPGNYSNATLYIRADAPVTLSQALTCPEVQALVEALKHYAKDYDHERGCSMWDGGSLARAALAALQGKD